MAESITGPTDSRCDEWETLAAHPPRENVWDWATQREYRGLGPTRAVNTILSRSTQNGYPGTYPPRLIIQARPSESGYPGSRSGPVILDRAQIFCTWHTHSGCPALDIGLKQSRYPRASPPRTDILIVHLPQADISGVIFEHFGNPVTSQLQC